MKKRTTQRTGTTRTRTPRPAASAADTTTAPRARKQARPATETRRESSRRSTTSSPRTQEKHMNRYDPRSGPDRHTGEYYFGSGNAHRDATTSASQRRRSYEPFGYEDFGDRFRDEHQDGRARSADPRAENWYDDWPVQRTRRSPYNGYTDQQRDDRYDQRPSRSQYTDRREDADNRDEYGQFMSSRDSYGDGYSRSGGYPGGYRDRSADRDRNQYGEFTRARPTYGVRDDEDDDRGGYGDYRGTYADPRRNYGDHRGGHSDNRGEYPNDRGNYADNRGGYGGNRGDQRPRDEQGHFLPSNSGGRRSRSQH